MHTYVHFSVIYNSQHTEAPKFPGADVWIKKVVVYVYNGVLSSHPKEWDLTVCDTMVDLEDVILSEISHKEEDKCYMISLIFWI